MRSIRLPCAMNITPRCGYTSSVLQARHLLLKEKATKSVPSASSRDIFLPIRMRRHPRRYALPGSANGKLPYRLFSEVSYEAPPTLYAAILQNPVNCLTRAANSYIIINCEGKRACHTREEGHIYVS